MNSFKNLHVLFSVAGQGADPDGKSSEHHLLCILTPRAFTNTSVATQPFFQLVVDIPVLFFSFSTQQQQQQLSVYT